MEKQTTTTKNAINFNLNEIIKIVSITAIVLSAFFIQRSQINNNKGDIIELKAELKEANYQVIKIQLTNVQNTQQEIKEKQSKIYDIVVAKWGNNRSRD